jgi:hypothetical protein
LTHLALGWVRQALAASWFATCSENQLSTPLHSLELLIQIEQKIFSNSIKKLQAGTVQQHSCLLHWLKKWYMASAYFLHYALLLAEEAQAKKEKKKQESADAQDGGRDQAAHGEVTVKLTPRVASKDGTGAIKDKRDGKAAGEWGNSVAGAKVRTLATFMLGESSCYHWG